MLDETTEREANRRAAVAYLQTAINTADGPLRNALRRRAAELILPRGRGPRSPWLRIGQTTAACSC